MARYICRRCNFRFEAKNANECGYCGRGDIEIEKNAGELLEDVDKILDD